MRSDMNERRPMTIARAALFAVVAAGLGAAPGMARAEPSAAAPLTLAEALRTARAHQPALQQAASTRAAAGAQAEVSRASLLPQVTAAASYVRSTANSASSAGPQVIMAGQVLTTGASNASSWQTYPYYRLGITANQLIWDFGQSLNQWKAARTTAEAQAEAQRTAEVQVAYNVRVAFFTARAAKDLVDVARDTLANLERHLNQIEGFVQLGSRPEIDVTQARADRANGRVQLINAENSYDVARAQLNLAMGVERGVEYALSDETMPSIDGEDAATEALVAQADRARPELANLRLAVAGRELTLRSTRDEHWPSLGFSTGLTDNGGGLDRLAWNWTGALTLSVPIFLGGSVSAQTRQQEALLLGARAQLDQQHQQVRLEVEQARLGLRAAKALVEATQDALANTRDRLRLAEGRYQTGVGNIIELGDAQVAATAAAAQSVQAQYQVFTARAQLLKALGQE